MKTQKRSPPITYISDKNMTTPTFLKGDSDYFCPPCDSHPVGLKIKNELVAQFLFTNGVFSSKKTKEVLELRAARCMAESINTPPKDNHAICCPVCIKVYIRRPDYAQHALSHHQVPLFATTVGEFTCEVCSHRFATKLQVGKHVKKTHAKKSYGCDHCDNISVSQVGLVTHMRVIHPELSFALSDAKKNQCPQCMKRFNSSAKIVNHIAAKHQPAPSLQCGQCHAEYASKDSLRNHKRIKQHMNPVIITETEPLPVAKLTDDASETMSDLKVVSLKKNLAKVVPLKRNHADKAMTGKAKTHMCGRCYKFFKTPAQLKKHIPAVHDFPSMNLQCLALNCLQNFPTEEVLKEHCSATTHTLFTAEEAALIQLDRSNL